MPKPNWKDAPGWAEHVALDLDGEWYWFENTPYQSEYDGGWFVDSGRTKFACSEDLGSRYFHRSEEIK